MRIIVRSKIYRAFPELDSYADEQCERFVRAAMRSRTARLLRAAAILAVFGAGLPVAFLAMAWTPAMAQHMLDLPGVLAALVVIPIAIMFVGVGISPTAAFITRDVLLRRRLRSVLRDRGACDACRYSLIGLPVVRGHVVCPECGAETHVDESLGELTVDAAGRPRFTPRPPPPPPRWRRLLTAARARRLRRAAAWTSLAAVLLLLASALAYEVFLRWQASVAAAERPGPGGIEAAMAAASARGPDDGGPDPWSVLRLAMVETNDLSTRVRAELLPAETRQIHSFPAHQTSLLGVARRSPPADVSQAAYERMWAASEMVVERARQAGIWDRSKRITEAPIAHADAAFGPGQPAAAELWWPHHALQFGQLIRVRAQMALDGGDVAELTDSLRLGLAVARLLRARLTPRAMQAAAWLEWDLYGDALSAIRERPNPDFISAMEGLAQEAAARPGLADLIEGQRLRDRDTLAWLCETPARARWGIRRGANPVTGIRGVGLPAPVRYRRQAGQIDAFYATRALLASPRAGTSPPFSTAGLPPWLAPNGAALLPEAAATLEAAELRRVSVLASAAIERYHADHGEYPATLAALVPQYLLELPIDPFTLDPLSYRVSPAEHGSGASFVLLASGIRRRDRAEFLPRAHLGTQPNNQGQITLTIPRPGPTSAPPPAAPTPPAPSANPGAAPEPVGTP